MKKASENLAELKTYQALATYEQQGYIKKIDSPDLKSVAQAYVERAKQDKDGLLLASTRVQCQDLNDEASTPSNKFFPIP